MSDKQNNDFAARLARIEGKSGVRPTAQPTQPRLDYDDGPLIKLASWARVATTARAKWSAQKT